MYNAIGSLFDNCGVIQKSMSPLQKGLRTDLEYPSERYKRLLVFHAFSLAREDIRLDTVTLARGRLPLLLYV